MRWNSFKLISPAYKRAKKRLFPFEFIEWVKLFIISILASSSGGNFNIKGNGYSKGKSGLSSGTFDEVTSGIREGIKRYWEVGAIIFGIGFVLTTIFSYIKSVFNFIFIDALVGKSAKFTFSKNKARGTSLFLFKFIISVVTLILIGLLLSPYLYHFMNGNPIIDSVGIFYMVVSIIAAFVYVFILWILFLFLYDFVVPYMYSKNTQAWFSLRKVWSDVMREKLAVIVYLLSRIVIGIALAILVVIGFGVSVLIVGIVGVIIYGIGYLLNSVFGLVILFVILGVLLGIVLLIGFVILFGLLIVPISVFMKYFELLNFEKLMGIKILK